MEKNSTKSIKQELITKYEISIFDVMLYEFFQYFLGIKRTFSIISIFSEWKYGKKDNLSRFCAEYCFHIPVEAYSFGWKSFIFYSNWDN